MKLSTGSEVIDLRQWNLIKLRKDMNLTQEEFARLVMIKISPYRNKEIGKVEFTSREMFRIAKFLGKEIEDIFLDTNSTESGNNSINSIKSVISING